MCTNHKAAFVPPSAFFANCPFSHETLQKGRHKRETPLPNPFQKLFFFIFFLVYGVYMRERERGEWYLFIIREFAFERERTSGERRVGFSPQLPRPVWENVGKQYRCSSMCTRYVGSRLLRRRGVKKIYRCSLSPPPPLLSLYFGYFLHAAFTQRGKEKTDYRARKKNPFSLLPHGELIFGSQ